MERVLTPAAARVLYDRIGKWQDRQAFYEDRPVMTMMAHAAFPEVRAVFEFGCGTGRLAARLLADLLPPEARYEGVDISPVMVRIAAERLRSWPEHAAVHISDGAMRLAVPDGSIDRFISTYVLDLLSPEHIDALVTEARRVLTDEGLLCLISLTDGERGLPRLVSALWRRIHRLRPQLIGGCRPIRLRDFLPSDQWTTVYSAVVSAFGVTSEVVIAQSPPRSHPFPGEGR